MTVSSDETGRADDTPVESSPTPEVTGTDVPAESGVTAAEPENTETPQPQEHMIPKSRLDEVIAKRGETERQLEAVQAELERLRAPAEAAPAEADRPAAQPPPGLNERDNLRWYIENDTSEWFERKFGMTPDQAKTALATTAVTSQAHAQQLWKEACGKHSLDAASREVQEMVGGLVKVGVARDDAFARAAKLYGKAAAAPAEPTAAVEGASVTPVMASARMVPRNRQQAQEMAEKGQRAPDISSAELIAQAVEREKTATPARVRSIP